MFEPPEVWQIDGFDLVHSVMTGGRGSLMVDEGSSERVVVFRRRPAKGQDTGNTDHEETLAIVLQHWIRDFGRIQRIHSDPESNYRAHAVQDWAAAHSIQWNLSPAEPTGGQAK